MVGKPGRSGRKRVGAEPKVNFNTKIDPELRDQLQSAADEANRSLSREIELRLQNSLVPAGKVDEATRALCLLVMEAAKQTSDGSRNWTNDASLHYAFTRSVALIISMVRAAGRSRITTKIDAPFRHPVFKSPEELARAVVLRIGNDLVEAKAEPQERAFRALGNPAKWLRAMRKSWELRGVPGVGFHDDNVDKLREMLIELDGLPILDTAVSPQGAILHRLAELVNKQEGKS